MLCSSHSSTQPGTLWNSHVKRGGTFLKLRYFQFQTAFFQGRSWHIFHFWSCRDHTFWGRLPGKGLKTFFASVLTNPILKVRKIHSDGGWGSQGYGYNWKREEAAKNLLRTHTTAVSARMLYKWVDNQLDDFYLCHVTGLLNRRSSSLKSISQLTGSLEMKPWMQPTLQSSTKLRWVFKL